MEKPALRSRAPLHRGAAAIAIAEIEIIAHPDLVAVVEDRRSGHGEEKNVEQLDFAPAVREQRREPAANAEIDPRRRIGRVNAPHVIALLVGHHLERELVVIAQEHRPLAVLRNRRRLLEDVDDRKPILHLQRHEHPRHEREMEIHVRLVAFAEIRDRVFRPLVRFRQQHAVLEISRPRARAISSDMRGSRAGFRSSCLRVRRDRERHRAAGRRRPCFNQKSSTFSTRFVDRRDYRNSDPADANKSDASNTPSPPDPTTSSRSRNL